MLGPEDFAGTWSLRRRITDRYGGQSGLFEGHAKLTPTGRALLRYAESGTLRLGPAAAFHAERAYGWRFADTQVQVTFADGGPFHHFTPTGVAPGTDHPCGHDLYRVLYDFQNWPAWQTTWNVSGPRKDYDMVSLYTRA